MYIWECACIDCGHEFEYIDSYAPLECTECGSCELNNEFKGRAYV